MNPHSDFIGRKEMNYLKILMDLYGLKKNVKLSAGKMRSLQEKKLRRLLKFAWEHSAYYRKAFENAGITKEQLDTLPLSRFPAINKQTLLSTSMNWSRYLI